MRYLLTLLVLAVFTSSCTTVNVNPDDAGTSAGNPSASNSEKKDEKKDPFKPWDEILKDTRAIDGVIKTHLKRDQTLYFELAPDQLGKDFGMFLHFSRGLGDFFAYDGLSLSNTRLIRFERIGDQIYLIHRNPNFIADEGSPMKTSLDDNVGHSILEVAKIESQNKESNNVLIDVTGFFVSDYVDLSETFKFFYGNKPVSFDKKSSYVERVQGFPKNLEVDAALTYKAGSAPTISPDAVSDHRSLPVGLRYSIFALPDDPMNPRLADDRVGHFVNTKKDFSRDTEPSPYLHYVNRWRLEKKDPGAAISEPVNPIVYYIDRSVPTEYRRWVREGIEGWNKAFEMAGFKNAVVAKEAPENDSTWSAEDMRYSTVRWSAAHRMGFAIGPSQIDPRTGEILNADVLVSSEFVSGFLDEYARLGPDAFAEQFRSMNHLHEGMPEHLRGGLCMAESGASMQLGFQHLALAGLGVVEPGETLPADYVGDAIRWLILHEVGHTLGLRHNFKASSGIPYESLNDKAFTGKHGLILSVMDYPPVNITPDREQQGHYWSPVVGTYDDWAIKYAYIPVEVASAAGTNRHGSYNPADELPQLLEIARQASDPFHTYGTDEDNWLGPWAVDPNSNAWDLGSDALQYARDRVRLVEMVTPELEDRLLNNGDAYYRLRGARVSMLWERLRAVLPAAKMVGGIYHVRDHKGDPGNRQPFTPVPAQEQREAIDLIVDQLFAADALTFEPETLNKLAPDRMWYFSYQMRRPVDFPAHDYVSAIHSIAIDELMHPTRFQRIMDNELRAGDDALTVSEVLETLTDGVWGELESDGNINSFRRNLQRQYTERLIRLMHDAPAWRIGSESGVQNIPTPEHVRSLARLELTELQSQIDRQIASGKVDRDTKAHLLETQARVERALKATVTAKIDG